MFVCRHVYVFMNMIVSCVFICAHIAFVCMGRDFFQGLVMCLFLDMYMFMNMIVSCVFICAHIAFVCTLYKLNLLLLLLLIIMIIAFKGAIRDFSQSPQCISNTYAQVARARSCRNHVRHVECLSCARCRVMCHVV